MPNKIQIKRSTGSPGFSLELAELGYSTDTQILYIGNGVGEEPTYVLTSGSGATLDASNNFTGAISAPNINGYNSAIEIFGSTGTIKFSPFDTKNYEMTQNINCSITIDDSSALIEDVVSLNVPPATQISSITYTGGTIKWQKGATIIGSSASDLAYFRTVFFRYVGSNTIRVSYISFEN